jgi:predicted nucleic acid-binding protein
VINIAFIISVSLGMVAIRWSAAYSATGPSEPVTLVLVDTSVWVAHFRSANATLQSLLTADRVLCHPLVVMELACGTPPAPRERTLGELRLLRQAVVATTDAALALIEQEQLQDSGCGAVDIALLASTLYTPGALLWTLDKKLDALASRLGVSFTTAELTKPV